MDHLVKLAWIASAKKDLKKFPENVQRGVGYALHVAQAGGKPDNATPLKGLGSNIIEIAVRYNTNTYRAVYLLREGVYVLHCFQKKSKQGIKTPKYEIDLIRQRINMAIGFPEYAEI